MQSIAERGSGQTELGLGLLGELQVDGGEVDAMFEGLLLRLHGFDFAPDDCDFLLDGEDFFDLAGALLEDGAQAIFGFAGVFEAGGEVCVLLGDFFAGLGFIFNAAEGPDFAEGRASRVAQLRPPTTQPRAARAAPPNSPVTVTVIYV